MVQVGLSELSLSLHRLLNHKPAFFIFPAEATRDWRERFGYPLLLVTFADPRHFHGTIYRFSLLSEFFTFWLFAGTWPGQSLDILIMAC